MNRLPTVFSLWYTKRMETSNYAGWQVDSQQFFLTKTVSEKMEFLLRFAILAPSSHNTQPWRFHIDEQGKSITIFADFSRRLVQSDATGRMLYIALGCALENIFISADHYGMTAMAEYNPKLAVELPEFVVKIYLQDGGVRMFSEDVFNAIPHRASYRAAYQEKEISREYRENLYILAKKENVHLEVMTSVEGKNALAEIGGEGMKNCMHGRAFRWELAHWLRSNITRAFDGMPGEGHEMSLPISLLAPFVLRFIDVSEVEKKKAIRRIKNFPAVGVLSGEDNALAWVKTGQALQRILLDLTAHDMAASIMVAAIEDGTARTKLTEFLRHRAGQAQGTSLPQMFFGFGYPVKQAPHSPRRKVENMLR